MSIYQNPTSIRLPKVLKDFLARRADDENRTLSMMIILILEDWRKAYMKAKHVKPGEQK